MTHSPNSGNRPDSSSNWRLRLLLRNRITITVSAILLVGIAGSSWWAWVFIHQKLVPLVETNLKQLLGRPVDLGEVVGFSLYSLRFSSLLIPATPTDPDRVAAEAVLVKFDPWQLLFNRTLELNVTLIQPDIYVEQAKNGQWVSTEINVGKGGTGFIQTNLQTIRVRDADVVLVPSPRPGRPNGAVVLDDVGGVARFLDRNQRIRFELASQPTRGGRLEIAGETRLTAAQTTLKIQGQKLQAADISRLIELPIKLQAGRIENANLTVQLQQNQQQPPAIAGTATISNVTAQIENIPQQFTNTTGKLRFRGQEIALQNFTTRYGKIPVQISGVLNTQKGYNLSGQVKAVSAKNLLDTFNLNSPVPVAGQLQANIQLQGAIRQPILTGTFRSSGTTRVDEIPFSNLSGGFRLTTAGTTPQISLTNLQATPTVGGQIAGNGQIVLGAKPQIKFDFQAENLPGDAIAQLYNVSPPISIGEVAAAVDISGSPGNLQTVAQLQAPAATYPGNATVVINNQSNIQLQNATFKVAGGTVAASGKFAKGQFQASVNATDVGLKSFSQQLRGKLNADLQLSGTSFQLADIQAQGQVRFSQGLALVEQPLTAQIRWNGEQIVVQKATAPGLNAQGTVAVQLQAEQAPQIAGFNLDVQTQGYDLQDLGLNFPGNVALAGQADFTGQVTGTPTAPNAVGNLRLRNLKVNGLAFDSVLAGNLNYQAGQRTELQLAGKEDKIALTLGANNRPKAFFVKRDRAIASGKSQGENLIVNVQDFPVAVLKNLVPGKQLQNIGAIAGELSGDLVVNLAASQVVGEIAIAQPQLGRFTAKQFRGQINYDNGAVALTEGELQLGDSRIAISGDVKAGSDRQFQFQIDFEQAKIENILQALSIFGLQDFSGGLQSPQLAGAQELQTLAVGLPEASVQTQLRLFSEIETQLQQQRTQRQASPLPTLAELAGTISGEIAVTGSLKPGLQPAFSVSFDLLGQDWLFGQYTIDEVIAEGSYNNGVLTLLPVRIDLGDALLAFTGQLGDQELSGQLRVNRFPVALIKPFLPKLPVQTTGELNALVTLGGSLADPRAIGEVALAEGTLNSQPVEMAQLSFSYNDARLNFGSTVLVSGTEPVKITGSIPAPLPFASVQPDSQQIRLEANVEDEGLALLNLFTDQVAWVDGQGQINVEVQGTLNQPIVQGNISVKNATFKAQALPKPLTDVTGTIEFNGDRLVVEGIQAQYNQGQLTAEGILPIFATQSAQQLAATNPLTVSLDNLNQVNLQGLYQGEVGGNVVITGTALKPNIGGEIRLMNGQVAIGESAKTASPTAGAKPSSGATPPASSPIEFTNLKLILGEDVRITRQPILNFVAAGDLTINGTLANPRPQGVVRLKQGQVNLFTTRFTLARGYEQTARFTPKGGLNPILDIRLVATVPEVTGSRIPTTPLSGEIADIPVTSSLRTIRVQARVTGPADELAENLELTSEPGRSESEIISLLGGSFVNTFGQGDALLGLANLAGSALLSPFVEDFTALGEAIGFSELRLYPTIVTDSVENISVLGLATEGIVDITDNFSVSLSRIFAADQPFRVNLLYRLNEQVLVRGSTNFAGESRALVEYEARF